MSGLPTIAIVDDDPGILRSIDSLIRSAGMTGTVFACAEAFLEASGHSHFDCLVTDVHMSGISGLDLREELMRRGSPPPTIIMTAFPTPALRERAQRDGIGAFLTKPVDPDELLATITAAVSATRTTETML